MTDHRQEGFKTNPIVLNLLKQPTHEQRSTEWYEQRNKRLTASDAAAALKMNKYSSREELLFKKCGMSKPFIGNEATRWGQKYEDEAIEIYEKFMGKKVHQFGLLNHHTLDCIAGSPDGITDDGIVIEVKCPHKRQIIPGDIPVYYMPQVQVVMECTNLDVCHFIQYKPAVYGNAPIFDIKCIPRDKAWFEKYYPKMREFWDEVLKYREIGIDKHPNYEKWKKRIEPKPPKQKALVSGPIDQFVVKNKVVLGYSDSWDDSYS